jgi:hypothetical protein
MNFLDKLQIITIMSSWLDPANLDIIADS